MWSDTPGGAITGMVAGNAIAEDREAATAVVGQREAARWPQISAVTGYTRTNYVDEFGVPLPNGQQRLIYPNLPNNYRLGAGLQWPVYTGGRQDAVERAARIEAEAVAAERDAVGEDLQLEITRTYWVLVTAGEAVQVVEAALTRGTSG